jgi:hypothetical protein
MEYHMNTHKLHAEFSDPGNNSVILHLLCLVTLFCGATIVSLHNILKFFNNEKSPPHLELKMKVLFHISNIREPENQSCQPNNLSNKDDPLEFQVHKRLQAQYINILHLWLILFSYIWCISITETASNINSYALDTLS